MTVSVRPRPYLRNCARRIFTKLSAHVACGRGSVLLWPRSDMLRTSGLWMTSYLLISQGCSTSPPS